MGKREQPSVEALFATPPRRKPKGWLFFLANSCAPSAAHPLPKKFLSDESWNDCFGKETGWQDWHASEEQAAEFFAALAAEYLDKEVGWLGLEYPAIFGIIAPSGNIWHVEIERELHPTYHPMKTKRRQEK